MPGKILVLCLLASSVLAQQNPANLRKADIPEEPEPPRIAQNVEFENRQARSYPEQPPLIPHKIDGYQVDLNANKCLSCHNRHRVDESGAPMVSVTHFMDRDMQMLAEVSPRRYFCQQCHVPQTSADSGVENTFEDVSTLIGRTKSESKR